MAKKKRTISEASMEENASAMLQGMTEGTKAAGIEEVSVGEILGTDVGIPMPALAPRYLFQRTCLPLSRTVMFSGEEGSGKSALLYEMMRWFLTHGGVVIFDENELKDAALMRGAVLQWNKKHLGRIQKYESTCIEEWQSFFTANLTSAKKLQTAKGGIGKTVPILFCLDSLMSTDTRAVIKDVEDVGHTSQKFAYAAGLITKWSRTLPRAMKDFPFMFMATNHLKPGTDSMGRPKNTTPGGKSMKFCESAELEMVKFGDLNTEHEQGLQVKLTARKNSLGASRKTIMVNLLWHTTPDGSQYSAWDWHHASIALILSFEEVRWRRNELYEACGIRVADQKKKTAYSDILGVSKDNAVPFRQLSGILETRQDILNKLYAIMGILPCKAYEAGQDYAALKLEAKKLAEEAVANKYVDAPFLPTMSVPCGSEISAASLRETEESSETLEGFDPEEREERKEE